MVLFIYFLFSDLIQRIELNCKLCRKQTIEMYTMNLEISIANADRISQRTLTLHLIGWMDGRGVRSVCAIRPLLAHYALPPHLINVLVLILVLVIFILNTILSALS